MLEMLELRGPGGSLPVERGDFHVTSDDIASGSAAVKATALESETDYHVYLLAEVGIRVLR